MGRSDEKNPIAMRLLSRSSRRGFTLIEILIAVTISTLVLAATYSLFRGTVKAWSVIRYDVQCMKTARKVFTIMEQDLRNLVVETGATSALPNRRTIYPSRVAFLWEELGASGVFDLVFLTTQYDGTEWKLWQVCYSFPLNVIAGVTDLSIKRQVNNLLNTTEKKQILAKEFSNVKIEFLDWDGTTFQSSDAWLSTQGLKPPKAIKITLVFLKKNEYQPTWTKTITIPYAMGIS